MYLRWLSATASDARSPIYSVSRRLEKGLPILRGTLDHEPPGSQWTGNHIVELGMLHFKMKDKL